MSACLALVSSAGAYAGASLLVDDAAVTPAGRCQVETWARAYSHGQELTAVPACNYAGAEFSLGVSEFFTPRVGPLLNLGVKHLWRDFDQESFGIGASLGATWSGDNRRVEIWNFSVPASFAVDAKRNLVLHANLGWLDIRGVAQGLAGGVGVERSLTEGSVLLAEFYAQHDHVRVAQLGLRRVLNDNISFDFLVGHQEHVADRPWFATVGFNILLP